MAVADRPVWRTSVLSDSHLTSRDHDDLSLLSPAGADRTMRWPLGWLCCLLLAGCVPTEPSRQAGSPETAPRACRTETDESALRPTLDSIQAHILGPRCAGCHGGPLPSMGMAMDDADSSHASLVEVRALEQPTLFRVAPGNAGDSYLIHKLEDRQLLGEPMPLGGAPLTDEEIGIVREWIDAGAAREAADADGPPMADCPDTPPAEPLEARLSSIQAHVFSPRCARCHDGESAAQGLRLNSADNSHADLVGVPSRQVPARLRVQPHQPDESYLVHKIEGRQTSGGRMPLGAPPLSEEQIAMIRQWITDGAAND